MIEAYDDAYWMGKALEEAQQAFTEGEVPVGAVVVGARQKILGRGHNQTERLQDVTAHAEMLALTAAADYLGGKYLRNCTLYVTLEPCTMCAGALFWSQIDRVVFGASDPKRGYQLHGALLHPKTHVEGGLRAAEAQALLQRFFQRRRL